MGLCRRWKGAAAAFLLDLSSTQSGIPCRGNQLASARPFWPSRAAIAFELKTRPAVPNSNTPDCPSSTGHVSAQLLKIYPN